jgi:hypothetical protein
LAWRAGTIGRAPTDTLARNGFKLAPASRTWLLVAVIFFAVSGWLWHQP